MKRKINICFMAALAATLFAVLAVTMAGTPTDDMTVRVITFEDEVITDETPITSEPDEPAVPTDETTRDESQAQECIWSEEEEYLLAKLAMAEAEGEDTMGKALVILVAVNRVDDDEFPDSIEEVIYQPGQFSVTREGGRWWNVEPDSDCYEALALVKSGWNESRGATYFKSRRNPASTCHDSFEFLFQHGKHYFYIERDD